MSDLHPVLLAALLMGACHGSKAPVATEAVDPAPTPQPFHSGTVSTIYVDDGCPFIVIMDRSMGPEGTITGPEAPDLLLPIGLDPQYLKSGLYLRFTYRLSRASSGGCTKGMPAILENITVLP